ncbi:hypothetical protein L6164_010109 [Bauhinia variegata]|uniref:Uncharacterized protein n=1 Tax=Bauhinia variegata TaxID=167791 RepID=A0ACB9PL14_BAUVA|nr:hypothetical protein L6164_010109 [Bauhinia variegata]
MESTTEHQHVISMTNVVGDKQQEEEERRSQFSFPTFRGKKIHCSLVPITSYLRDKKKSEQDTKKVIHSIKVGVALVLVSLLYLLDPLYEQVGENAMWAIMTVVVIFEFTAGATLGKGLNRGIGTISGGGLGCLAALVAQYVGGVGHPIIIGASVFVFSAAATYLRLVPNIKKRYDYGAIIFILTFNLVAVSGIRAEEVLQLARKRLLTIFLGFIVCISVSIFVFPLWASDELHHSTVSRFQQLSSAIQGCLEDYVNEKENEPKARLGACKSILNTKSKDESLVNFAKWEPWHGRFGFSYPWEKYLKIGDVLRELAAITVSLGSCLQSSRQVNRQTLGVHSVRESAKEACETIWWTLRELGDSIKEMTKCGAEAKLMPKLKVVRVELDLLMGQTRMGGMENSDVVATGSLVFLLTEVVDKVEELAKEIDQLGDLAAFRTH